jgi:hypothetical protein
MMAPPLALAVNGIKGSEPINDVSKVADRPGFNSPWGKDPLVSGQPWACYRLMVMGDAYGHHNNHYREHRWSNIK